MKTKEIRNYFAISFYLIVIIILSVSCSSGNDDEEKQNSEVISVINLAKAIESPEEPLKMSDFIESVEYIRPEYPETVIKIVFDAAVNDSIMLLETNDRLLCYTRQGKFLREISRKGQGPEEHLGIRSSALCNNLVAIHSNYGRKILWCNTDGNYLGCTPISGNVFKINILDTNTVAVHLHHGISMDDPDLFVAGIINRNGDTIQLKKTKPYYSKGMAHHSPSIWYCNDTIRVFTCINDTIYSITKNDIIPKYILELGKYKISRDAFKDLRLLEDERSQYIYGLSFFETTQHLLMTFQYDKKRWVSVYDKNTKKIHSWDRNADNVDKYGFIHGGGWENDVDGGVNLIAFKSLNNDYLVSNILPEKLIFQFYENKKNINVKYPKKQKDLEKMIKSVDEEENPIIMFYKLKK